ncbi:IS21 family transposase [Fusibacter ferrireducens]|uniref:IS21 family transposase n=1 Tax=Fusibacter ferrireducens TaxID=2785058 RepID=A0ABR9ZMC9_9FIRM|nr:IS21 family transposase [Fusibacter ferrireducens]MBF4691586.1 IS21 family transposase [Fusibacter ferrireducens]
MVNYREILRLKSLGYSQRQIAASVHSSRNTVKDVLVLASSVGIKWPLDEAATNESLHEALYPGRVAISSGRQLPDYPYIHKELAKPGVNLTLLWSEYCEKCYNAGATPYMYSQFCDKYRHWARITKATMRIKHKPGDTMQVDWAGNTIPVHDSVTGEVDKAYLFIAALPCSCYVYAEACLDMTSASWLSCHVHAYEYFGGVTRLLIPDNLKTGVIKNTRNETILNRSYQEMAEHYDTAIIPARVKRPKDKSVAEGSVKYASTWIIAALRNQKFFTIDEVRRAVREKLEELNNYPFKKREGNRHSAYFDEEQAFMKPLPVAPFEPADWSSATIRPDYLITDGINKYSVPFDLIGETLDIRVTSKAVEAFYHGSRVASHSRVHMQQRDPITKKEHMPSEHQKYLAYNKEDFLVWAMSVGPKTTEVVERFLSSGKEPEQGYKSCASLSKLADSYSNNRLEKACDRVLIYSNSPTIRNIRTILKNGQDRLKKEKPQPPSPNSYGITRGAAYYGKDGDQQ